MTGDRSGERFPLELADPNRGPTASPAAGLTLKAATTLMKAAKAAARERGVAISVAVVDAGGQLVAWISSRSAWRRTRHGPRS